MLPNMTALATHTQHAELLDAAVTYLVSNPRASLADIAAAAGIGRTTLFKRYATRDELEHAVAMRAVEVCVEAVRSADATARDGGLRSLVTALVPVGPQLNFLWRTPSLAVDEDFRAAYQSVDAEILAVLARARADGVLAAGQPDWWLHQTLVALVYVAWECVASGRLARLDAADRVVDTMLGGVGAGAP
jgi:TetR/AcrR family transcriptional repressor of lfrA